MRTDLLRVPSGTTLRFATLVGLAVATTLQIFGRYAAVWPTATSLDDARCQVRAGLYLTSTFDVDPDQGKWDAYRACMSVFLVPRTAWLAGGVLLLFGVALAIYFARPAWRIRRSHLVPLEGALADELRDTLAELVEQAGLRKAPEFVLDPTSWRAGGVAFGHHRRKVVCLDAGLVALHRRDPESFRAIVLHELAHVRGDVTTTYATLAVWRAFLIAVLLPYGLVLVNPMLLSKTPWKLPDFSAPGDGITWGIAWRLAVMVALVYLARTAVLRSREKSADALVVQWTGEADPYRNLSPSKNIRRWIAIHPTRAARSAAMRDPNSLLRPGFWEVLVSALAVQVAWWHAIAGLRELTWYREGNQSMLVMRIVWAVIAAALVGTIAFRGAVFLRTGGARRGVFALPGLALGIGFVLGDHLDTQDRQQITALGATASVLLVITAVLVCCWVGHCATLARVRWHAVLIAGATAVVCYSTLGWFAEIGAADAFWRNYMRPVVELLQSYGTSAVDDAVLNSAIVPFLLNFDRLTTAAALGLLWLVPLVLRRELPRFALLAALVGAGAWLLIMAAVAVADPSPALVRSAWAVLAVAVVQFATAAVVARRVDRIAALLSAWLVGLVATVAIWITHLDGFPHVDSALATRPMQVLPFLGTAAALLGGLAATGTRPAGRQTKPWGLIAIAVVSAVLVAWWPTAPKASPLQPPPPSGDTELNRDQAVNIWIYGGGWDTYMSVINSNGRVFDQVRANDRAKIASACDELLPVLRDAAAFPEPPEERVRGNWKSALGSLENGAHECVRVFRNSTGSADEMGKQFVRGLDQLKVTQTMLVEAQQRALS